MCNRYNVKTNLAMIAELFEARLPRMFDFSHEVLPKSISPGILQNDDGHRELVPMQFAFSPVGNKAPTHDKYPFNNARIESVEKWPWKPAVERWRCVVPLDTFREPCYWGEPAGSEVSFSAVDGSMLAVAALYRTWVSPDGDQELVTMSFLMRPALPYVMTHGHHRSPFLIEREGIDDWIGGGDRPVKESLAVLRRYAAEPELTYEVDRHMAAAWTRRQPAKLKDRDRQLDDIAATGPLGI